MILWSENKNTDLSKVLTADVVKTLEELRRNVISDEVLDCGVAGPKSKYKLCWVCTIPKDIGGTEAWLVAEDCLTAVIGAKDPYEFEVWPSRNGRALTLKAIDAALVLAGMS